MDILLLKLINVLLPLYFIAAITLIIYVVYTGFFKIEHKRKQSNKLVLLSIFIIIVVPFFYIWYFHNDTNIFNYEIWGYFASYFYYFVDFN